MNAAAARLPLSPSKTLIKFVDEIALSGDGPVLDAPCGYGRNAVALAARGRTVVAVDNDRRRLAVLERVKGVYIAESASPGVSIGRILTVCADLEANRWPIAPSSVSAIVCIHFSMITLMPRFVSSLRAGGCIYIETVGGQGQNYRELPRAGQLRDLLCRHADFRYYREQKVGPPEWNTVSVKLFARKW